MENPIISIITPVYNSERFIKETLNSVLDQDYFDWEHILVDDASTDSSPLILDSYAKADPRFRIIHLETNQGAAVARNQGLAAAKGRYVAFIDSDDIWADNKLAKQLKFMKNGNLAFSYTDFAFVDQEGKLVKESAGIPLKLAYHDLLKNTAIACSTVMIDRERTGDFRMPLVRKGQDTATWLQLMREQSITAYGLKDVLNYYRQVEGSISSDKLGALKRTWNTYYNIEELPFIKASYYFGYYVFNAVKRRL